MPTVPELIHLAESQPDLPPQPGKKSRHHRWAQLMPVIDSLPETWSCAARVRWLVENGAVEPAQAKRAYETIAAILRQRRALALLLAAAQATLSPTVPLISSVPPPAETGDRGS